MKQSVKKILIIGCSGSEKSTLAEKMNKITRIPVIHLDNIYWEENWERVPDEKSFESLNEELNKDRWIMEGNYNSTLEYRIKFCDVIIFLDISRVTCLFQIFWRKLISRNHKRSDMAKNKAKFWDYEFLKWVWNFGKINRQNYYSIMSDSKQKFYILKSKKEIQAFLRELE